MNIIFDLDGTLIDAKPRLYKLFQYLVPSSNLSFDEYWQLKQNKCSHQTILTKYMAYKEHEIIKFQSDWMSLIETTEFLKYDLEIPDVRLALSNLQHNATLHVCTARQFREPVLEQLESFGLSRYINQVLVTKQTISKQDLIKQNVKTLTKNDWLVGDTGKDIQAGILLGIKTCAVLSGFMNEKKLVEYSPTIIVDSVNAFEFHIKSFISRFEYHVKRN